MIMIKDDYHEHGQIIIIIVAVFNNNGNHDYNIDINNDIKIEMNEHMKDAKRSKPFVYWNLLSTFF